MSRKKVINKRCKSEMAVDARKTNLFENNTFCMWYKLQLHARCIEKCKISTHCKIFVWKNVKRFNS